jgi:phosphate/sulfate permease
VITFLIVSPIIGFVLAYIVMVAVTWISHKSPRHKVEGVFRKLSLFLPVPTAWAMGQMTRKKKWASLLPCCWQRGKKTG